MSEQGIRIGAAGNQAAMLLQGIGARGDVPLEQISGMYAELLSDIVAAMNGLEAGQSIGEAFAGAFPGTQVVEPPAAPFVHPSAPATMAAPPTLTAVPAQAPVQAPAAPVAPAGPPPVPGVAQDPEEQLWVDLLNNPDGWYDNRYDKKNPNGPDFKSKTIPQHDNPQYKAGLWIGGRTMPAWVGPELTARGLNK